MDSQEEVDASAPLVLAEEIHALTTHLRKVNTARRRFYLGVLGGVGGVIGATILAAPLLYMLSKILIPFGLDFPEI